MTRVPGVGRPGAELRRVRAQRKHDAKTCLVREEREEIAQGLDLARARYGEGPSHLGVELGYLAPRFAVDKHSGGAPRVPGGGDLPLTERLPQSSNSINI